MVIRRITPWFVFSIILVLSLGCGSGRSSANRPPQGNVGSLDGKSDLEKVRSADVSVLYVGNSHTSMHDLPNLIGEMIRFRHPEKSVYAHFVGVGFLEDVAHNPQCKEEIESRPWKYIVLQAQKESRSGRFKYSQVEGIAIAKLGKVRGAKVLFFAEWGLQDVKDHGPRIEQVYQEMATAAGAQVAPIGRAWDLALSIRPDMPLHSGDGNHQSTLGAFLTGCVLFGRLTDESPAALASFPYPGASDGDRKFLADIAVKALTTKVGGGDKN